MMAQVAERPLSGDGRAVSDALAEPNANQRRHPRVSRLWMLRIQTTGCRGPPTDLTAPSSPNSEFA